MSHKLPLLPALPLPAEANVDKVKIGRIIGESEREKELCWHYEMLALCFSTKRNALVN